MLKTFIAAATAAFLGLAAASAAAAADKVNTGRFSNLAVNGHDVVAYFSEGAPVRGSSEFVTEYKGAKWQFSSQENLNAFTANPEKYAPQYGGYCAWAVSQGYTAPGNPKFWKIVDGKLYLNFNQDVQNTWNTDIPGFITAADANWPSVLS